MIIHTRSPGFEPRVLTTVDTNASIVLHYLMSIDNLYVIILMTNTNVVIRLRSCQETCEFETHLIHQGTVVPSRHAEVPRPLLYASPRISSHLIFSIYIDGPGLAVPINTHYSSLLSRLWSNIPAQCPFMIETLTLYCFTAAKPLPKCYQSLRSNYSLRWSGLF